MKKIQYDIHDLIGDLLSKDGFYVDLMSCKEFTIWYLLRQMGIRSYAPIMGTVCFINETAVSKLDNVLEARNNNSKVVFNNAYKYFKAKRRQYAPEDGSYKEFIKNAIDNGHFVYSLFDNLYNSLAYFHSFDNEKHGHPIVGYDDDRKIYLGLLSNQREITYDDLDKMILDGYNQYHSYDEILYYYEEAKCFDIPHNLIDAVKKECIEDIHQTINDWETELNFFKREVESINKSVKLTKAEKEKFANEKNGFYNILMIGFHGDFMFKLRLIEELFDIDMSTIEERFVTNRKKASVIANMFRKSLIILKKDEDYFDYTMPRIAEKVNHIYIKEAKRIKRQFLKKIKEIY